ncbi:MAG: hypothetical protein IJ906_16350 [Oscillospiraceae bacterium]|nr:hypothetical protein [Oscillospiraceae bacterium]
MKRLKQLLAIISAFALLSCPIHAAADSNGSFELGRDAWAFTNNSATFQKAYKNNLLPEHLAALQSNLNHVEYRLIEPALEWTESLGFCYGFAATSILASYDIFNPDEHQSEIGAYADRVDGDLSSLDRLEGLDMNKLKPEQLAQYPLYEQSLIAYYMALQNTDAIRQDSVQKCDWSAQKKLEYLMECGKQHKPVLVAYNGAVGDQYNGHALVAYGLENGEWTWDGESYDTRILIYDPNISSKFILSYGEMDEKLKTHPTVLAAMEYHDQSQIYYNSKTHAWTVPSFRDEQKNGVFDLICCCDDVSVINSKGLLPGTEDPSFDWTDVIATNTLQSAYTITVRDSGEQLEEYPWFYMDGDEAVRQNFVHRGDETGYTLELESPQKLHSVVYYQNCMLVGDGDAGKAVNFDPSGKVTISGGKGGYSVEMVTNEHYPTQWHDIIVSGNAENASLEMQENGYLLKADDLHSVQITAKNCQNRRNQFYSADTDSILFYEKSGGVLAAAVDLDGNGSYETELAEQFILGDVNQDGHINAKDANAVLIAASRIGTGQNSGLNTGKTKAADVDHDGNINAVDASWILRYAAAIGTGTVNGTLDEFVEKGQ